VVRIRHPISLWRNHHRDRRHYRRQVGAWDWRLVSGISCDPPGERNAHRESRKGKERKIGAEGDAPRQGSSQHRRSRRSHRQHRTIYLCLAGLAIRLRSSRGDSPARRHCGLGIRLCALLAHPRTRIAGKRGFGNPTMRVRVISPLSKSPYGSKLRNAREFVEFLWCQFQRSCADIFLEMLDRRRARNWQHDGRALQQPG